VWCRWCSDVGGRGGGFAVGVGGWGCVVSWYGAALTVRSTGNIWSYPNLHGDITCTANQTGTKTGTTATYDPNGNQTAGTNPDNATGNFDNRWLGQHQRPTETEPTLQPAIEMGARHYSPRLGRFLQTDSITGGSANAYTYVFGDPNNVSDLTGLCGECWAFAAITALFNGNPEQFVWGFGEGRFEMRSSLGPTVSPGVARLEPKIPSYVRPNYGDGIRAPGIDWNRMGHDIETVAYGVIYADACYGGAAVGALVSHGIPVLSESLGAFLGCGAGVVAAWMGSEPIRKPAP